MITPDQLLRLDRPGPRYTSYPTVPVWTEDGVSDADLRQAVAAVRGEVSVYVHVPFCKEQCWFCGCNQVVSRRQSAGDRYLDALERQLRQMPLPQGVHARRIHLGGGTPTWLDGDQLRRLVDLLDETCPRSEGAEFSVEIDPDVTSDAQLDLLAERGCTRISLGVQSTDDAVLQAIHRPQDTQRVIELMARARAHGMTGLNVDLVYGLPHQTPTTFARTLDVVGALAPDRLAAYSYAHVPWLKRHQQRIDEGALPAPADKLGLFLQARQFLAARGYEPIGMDHFARPDDELAVAARAGHLHRNFMGYTTMRGVPLIGYGVSAISEVGGLFAQQQPHLGAWYRAMADVDGPPVVHRGYRMTDDDHVRSELIAELMCNFALDVDAFEVRHGLRFADAFASELAALAPLVDDGLVNLSPRRLQVTELGRLLVRNVAMCFDAHLGRSGARFSRTV